VIRPQGDRCVIFELGDRIDADIGLQCLSLAQRITQATLAGVTDVIPSFVTVAIQFEPHRDHHGDPCTYFEQATRALLAQAVDDALLDTRIIDIPVCYDAPYATDLAWIAQTAHCTEAEIIQRHSQSLGRVFMLGFAPGQPYIGILDPILNIPRRTTPRTAVPAGSVAIANRQTTVYPNQLPGGWHIIGATPLSVFDIQRTQPSLLEPGDQVRFVPISAAHFKDLQAASEP